VVSRKGFLDGDEFPLAHAYPDLGCSGICTVECITEKRYREDAEKKSWKRFSEYLAETLK
jgi:hypothetical protein